MHQGVGQVGQLLPQILADQKAPPGSGGAPHYYLPPWIFDPWGIPEYIPTMPEAEYKIITKTFELSIGVLKIKSNFENANIFWIGPKKIFTTKFYLLNIVEKVFPFPQ